MTGDPVTVKPDDQLEGCMAMMSARGFRHLPVLDAGKVAGVDLDQGRRQGHHPRFGAQRGRPDGLHHDGRPRGLTGRTAMLSPASGRENGGAPLTGHPPAAEETASYRLKQMF